ncbi:MAG: papain-like cysteine protease family protein [Candidatus Aminicenantes bacterium]
MLRLSLFFLMGAFVLLWSAPEVYSGSTQIFEYRWKSPEQGHLISDIPYEKWIKRNYCGPACMAMVLKYWSQEEQADQNNIAAEVMDKERDVAFSSEMVFYAREKGFDGYAFTGEWDMVKRYLEQNIPLIVLNRPINQVKKGHYRLLTGFDEGRNLVIFHDPYFGPNRAMKIKDFLQVWKMNTDLNGDRWTFAVLPSARALDYPELQDHPVTHVNLATAYYRRDRFRDSFNHWTLAHRGVPDDPYPLYSLGMVCIRMEDFDQAAAYAQEALTLNPDSAYALDVLGLARFKQGKVSESLKILGNALKLNPQEWFIRNHYLQVRDYYIRMKKRDEN